MKFIKNKIGILSGIGLIIIGSWLLLILLRGNEDKTGNIILLIYGLITIGLGIYMVFNPDKENKIEQIKRKKINSHTKQKN